MATLTVNKIVRAGLGVFGVGKDKVMAAAAAADEFANDGKTFIMVANDDAVPHAIVIATQKSILGLNVGEQIVSIAANMVDAEDFVLIGPFPPSVFNDASGKVQVTYTEATDGTGVDASGDFSILILGL